MALVTVPIIGEHGLIKDYPVSDFPLGAWTDSLNVRFRDKMCELIYGHGELSDNTGTASDVPYAVFHSGSSTGGYFLIMTLARAWTSAQGDGAWAEHTRTSTDYTGTAADKWRGGCYGGLTIITNNVDVPQLWTGGATDLADLSNWDANKRCKVIRPYRNAWVALNTTESGTNYPHRVLISDLADAGSVPGSWDDTNATKLTYETDIYGEDHIVDGGQLKDVFIIYKERSCHVMQFTGQLPQIYRIDPLYSDVGILTSDCWAEVLGKHLVLTPTDLVLVDPYGTPVSVIDQKTRRYLFQNIDSAQTTKPFIRVQPYFNEAWVFFPSQGNTWCDMALMWNWKDNTCSLREVPSVSHAVVAPSSDALATDWDNDSGTWDGDILGWGSNEFTPGSQRIVMVSPTNTNLSLADSGNNFFGTAISARLYRSGLDFGQPDRYKLMRSVRPKLFGGSNSVSFRFGSHSELYGEVDFEAATTFDIDTDYQIDQISNGRYGALELTSTSDYWRLEQLQYDIEFGESY